jgi:pimeloyl-ACP methyl ester carboxylesterase
MRKINLFVKFSIIITLCLVFLGCTIIALEAYSSSFGRVEELSETHDFLTYFFWKDIDQVKYSREEVRFNSSGNKLQGFIYGKSNNNGLVIISHGLGGTADCYFPMIMYFVDKGWYVFAYNNTGVSGSEGESIRGLTQSVIDLDSALKYAKNSRALNGLPVMLVGHSWGGYAVCAVLNYDHNVKAVISFEGYNNGSDVFNELGRSEVGFLFGILKPQFWAIEKQLFGDTAKLTAIDGINKSGIPVMIVQSSDDDVISPKTTSIYAYRNKITNPRVEIVYLDGEDAAGHEFAFCSKGQREYMKWADSSWETYKSANSNASKLQWAEEIGFDKIKANELNMELMEWIDDLFNNTK